MGWAISGHWSLTVMDRFIQLMRLTYSKAIEACCRVVRWDTKTAVGRRYIVSSLYFNDVFDGKRQRNIITGFESTFYRLESWQVEIFIQLLMIYSHNSKKYMLIKHVRKAVRRELELNLLITAQEFWDIMNNESTPAGGTVSQHGQLSRITHYTLGCLEVADNQKTMLQHLPS